MIKELLKLANRLDEQGKYEEANIIDKQLHQIASNGYCSRCHGVGALAKGFKGSRLCARCATCQFCGFSGPEASIRPSKNGEKWLCCHCRSSGEGTHGLS